MDKKIKQAIEDYQCAGCVNGSNTKCGKFIQDTANESLRCLSHCAGTAMSGAGRFFLGMPKGFCRLGKDNDAVIYIFQNLGEWSGYDKFNVPVWKYVNEKGHTFVRMFMPRLNQGWLQVFLEDCRDKIECVEITADDMKSMD